MKSLIFTPNAAADIDGIYDYTEDQWGFEQAEGYTFGLVDARRLLAAGHKVGKSINSIRAGYWMATYKSHSIIYREKRTQIVVFRILHQQMNLARHL